MQRSAWRWFGLALLAVAGAACTEEGVGDPCVPENIPLRTGATGTVPGFDSSESFIEASSVQCRSRLCIVYKLDNKTGGQIPANPNNVCPPGMQEGGGCVSTATLNDSVHCTCKCGGPKTSEQCECPDGFSCEEILTLGGDGIKGKYCVHKKATATP